MRNGIVGLVVGLIVTLAFAGGVAAQPKGKGKGKGKGPPGPPARRAEPSRGLEGAVDGLRLSGAKEAATAAVKAHQETVRKLMELARAGLLLKMKETLSPDEFKKFKAAPQEARGSPGRGGGRLEADDVVERVLSFDKDKDGKVTQGELPERMQDLIAKGDANKDGALDKDEIKKLATTLARDGSFRGGGPGGRAPRGPGGRGGPGGGPPPDALERALGDLRLSGPKKEAATAAVKAHQETVRKLMELARADLLLKMSDVLGEEELRRFTAALDRPPGGDQPPARRPGPPGRGRR